MIKRMSYQMKSGDSRVHVFDGTTLVGWIIDDQFRPVVSEDQSNAMLDDVLKKKGGPPSPPQE